MSTFEEEVYNIFNAEGRLLQLEYGLEAVNSAYQTVTLLSKDAIIAISKKAIIPQLCVDEHRSIFKISQGIYMNITGQPADIAYVVDKAITLASSLEYEYNTPLTPGIFVRALADKFQNFMQKTQKRAPAFAASIFGFESGKPSLYYTDLTCIDYPYKAIGAGEDNSKINKYLEKHWRECESSEALSIGICSLLEAIGRDAEHTEVSACILTLEGLKKISGSEIDVILQHIAENQ